MSREGIVRAKFGELLKSRDERFPNDGTHPLYSLTIKDGVTPKTERYEREFLVTNKESKKYKVIRTGDLVFNPSNLRWGAIATSFIQFPVLASPIYEVFYPIDDQILDPYFLGALASSPILMARYLALVEGTLVERTALKKDDFLEIEIEIPPLPEQKKIAEILSGIDLVLGKTTAQISKLENLRVALICEFLSEGARQAEMPSGDGGNFQANCEWKMLPVSAIADFISGYAFSSPDFIDTGILCIRMGNLYQNKFQENRSSVFLPSEYLTKYPRFQVEAGDLLMSMTGTAGKRDYGFVVEVPDGTSKGLLNQRVGKIVPKTNHSKGYIKEVMRSPFYLEQLYEYGSGTKQANLTAGQIMEIVIPVPTLPTQLRIAKSLSFIQKKIDSLAVQSRKQKELLLSIRHELLSGRKRVSDARILEGVGI